MFNRNNRGKQQEKCNVAEILNLGWHRFFNFSILANIGGKLKTNIEMLRCLLTLLTAATTKSYTL